MKYEIKCKCGKVCGHSDAENSTVLCEICAKKIVPELTPEQRIVKLEADKIELLDKLAALTTKIDDLAKVTPK